MLLTRPLFETSESRARVRGETGFSRRERKQNLDESTGNYGVFDALGRKRTEGFPKDAYGKTKVLDAAGVVKTSAPLTEILWTGRRLDGETGNYYFRSRYFNTALGRFISRDVEYLDGNNLYESYFASRMAMDPEGYSLQSVVDSAVDGLLGLNFYYGSTQSYNWVFPSPVAGTQLALSVTANVYGIGCRQSANSCKRKNCIVIELQGTFGIYAMGTVRPGWNPPPSNWTNPISINQLRQHPFQPGRWMRVPFAHGIGSDRCPTEGFQFQGVVNVSVGFWGWTAGAQGILEIPAWQFRWRAGMGIGQGTGVSGGVGGSITKCWEADPS